MAKDNNAIVKRDTRVNWNKSKYIPKENVIIIMDNEDNTISEFKRIDGKEIRIRKRIIS